MDSRLEETKNFFDEKADTWDNESIYSPNLIKAVAEYRRMAELLILHAEQAFYSRLYWKKSRRNFLVSTFPIKCWKRRRKNSRLHLYVYNLGTLWI